MNIKDILIKGVKVITPLDVIIYQIEWYFDIQIVIEAGFSILPSLDKLGSPILGVRFS